jgi:hypothetical protein
LAGFRQGDGDCLFVARHLLAGAASQRTDLLLVHDFLDFPLLLCRCHGSLLSFRLKKQRLRLRDVPSGNQSPWRGLYWRNFKQEASMGRGVLLWLLGVPIPVIILLALIWR